MSADKHNRAGALEVLQVFLKLGLSSFGGPIAHLGYFRAEFVARRRWLDEEAFADLVALCQFLPGPASSQVGFSIGLLRAGYTGALAAWTGFTLPSSMLLVLFAYGSHWLTGPFSLSVLRGLKLVAVAIVAQAVWGMARSFCRDWQRAGIAIISLLCLLRSQSSLIQIAVIAGGALLGSWLCRDNNEPPLLTLDVPVSRPVALIAMSVFSALLLLPPLVGAYRQIGPLDLFAAFYRSGALVFGGGHVVLPMLRQALVAPGWISDESFLAGYGAAQAVPGPLFTFAAYLGAIVNVQPSGVAGSALGLVAIFLPGMLLLIAALPFWNAIRHRASARAAMHGVNAAVVGLLAAALYRPVWTNSVHSARDVVLALIGFISLVVWRVPPLVVVVATATGALVFDRIPA